GPEFVKLSTRDYGTGEPILLMLHGLFGSGDNWHTIARRLEANRHIVTADLRNHGDSPHSDLFTFPAMAADIRELLDLRGVASADLLGHSLGGKVAMEFALSHPEAVGHLIVVDIAPKRYRPHNIELRDAMLALDLSSIRTRRDAEDALSKRVPERSVQLFLLKNLVHEENGGFHWRLNLEGISKSFDETGVPIARGRRFDGPVLFLYGERSNYVEPREDAPLIYELFPNAQIRSIENATHWVHADAPNEVVREIEGFLSDSE
ncbi:MAG TPA: alpha/beta fold hydrolase, partial [Spirochaetia bacterium]|nr:alpha/beta fold hydrolase [Spirochaetia bacterium]